MILKASLLKKVSKTFKGSCLESAIDNIIHNYDATLIVIAAYAEEFIDNVLADNMISLNNFINEETERLTITTEYDISISKEEFEEFIGNPSNDLYYAINMLILQYMNAFGISKAIKEKNIEEPKKYMYNLIEVYFNVVLDNLGPVSKNATVLFIIRDIVRRRKYISKFRRIIE